MAQAGIEQPRTTKTEALVDVWQPTVTRTHDNKRVFCKMNLPCRALSRHTCYTACAGALSYMVEPFENML